MLDTQDVIVVGAGVVGLSIARALAAEGRRVLVLERESAAGHGGSSRSSGVVHAGLHHPSDWLKSRLARRGRGMLQAFCARHAVPMARVGKWIVACDPSERDRLRALHQRADALHLTTRWLEAAALTEEEPALTAHAALEIAETGVVRTAELVRALQRELEAMAGQVLIGADVERIEPGAPTTLALASGARLRGKELVVAAGLHTDLLLRRSGLDTDALGLTQHRCKGEWMALDGVHRKRVSRHVYPLPDADGLGIHLTRDLDGYLYAGPDTEWLEGDGAHDHTLSPHKIELFGAALRRFYPGVADRELHPMMAGIRPKLSRAGEPPRDFSVWSGAEHGWPHVTALLGIESPGLTACLALGEHVASQLG